MPELSELKNTAKKKAQEVLSQSASFMGMPIKEQKELYNHLVGENLLGLVKQHGLESSMADGPGTEMGFKGYDPGMDKSVDAFEGLVESVNFPKFVADLLKAVFDANISVMKQQTDSYIKLMKEATKGVADFVKKVKDDDTFSYLAESKPDMYNISMEKDENGNNKLSLTSPQGEKLDVEDNEVKVKIMDAKIAMAKEHRAALREVILMGVTRLVVEKGIIEAGVDFEVTAKRKSDKANSNTNINNFSTEGSYGGGLSSVFGGPSVSVTETNTNINVSTSNKSAEDNLTAKLHGKVNIQFKTDYFKLDNFAQMYADGGVAALKPNAPQQIAAPAK
jgi:hypothetical protein